MVTDPHLGLVEEVMKVREIAKSISQHASKLAGWDEDLIYPWGRRPHIERRWPWIREIQ